MITATRYHDISAGHRVAGHPNKCSALHGHNYRFHFTVGAPRLDDLGMVMDFGIIKKVLCQWLEDHWDHKFLIWEHDPVLTKLNFFESSLVICEFNPTAENMAQYFCEVIAPDLLGKHNVVLVKLIIEETRKCSATYEIEN